MEFPDDLGLALGSDDWLKAAASLGGVMALLALRQLAIAAIRAAGHPLSDRQRWGVSTAKNVTTALIVLGLAWIWAAEIEEFALSLAAVAVAVVIATKELLLCVAGAIWRGASPAIAVGEWVEIGPHSGEVMDESLLATTLQEVDPVDFHLTGRVVAVPNSLLLVHPVVNHGFRKRFVYLDFPIVSPPRADAGAVRARIEAALAAAAKDFAELARRYAHRVEQSAGVRLRDPRPTVRIETNDYANLVFRCSVFCPRDQACALRDVAMGAYLAGPAA